MITEKQRELRRSSVGSSDAAAIMGYDPWRSPLEVYLDKFGMIEKQQIKFGSPIYWGNLLEDAVAKAYEDCTKRSVRKSLMTLRHAEHDFIVCHLDRKIRGQRKILECKTTHHFNAAEWGEIGSDQIPLNYILQVQHQMAVTGYCESDVAVLIGGNDFRCYTIKRDESIIESILKAEVDFWFNNIIPGIPPELSSKKDVLLLYKIDNGIPIDCTDEIAESVSNMHTLKYEIKKYGEQQEELEKKVAIFMKDASSLIYYGKEILTWKADKNGRRAMRIKL